MGREEKGSTILPKTALPDLRVLVIWIVSIAIAVFVVIIDAHDRASKGGSFTEGDEYGLVYLSGRVDLYAYMEQYKTTEDDQCGDDELGNIFGCFVHMRFLNPVQRYDKKTKPPRK